VTVSPNERAISREKKKDDTIGPISLSTKARAEGDRHAPHIASSSTARAAG